MKIILRLVRLGVLPFPFAFVICMLLLNHVFPDSRNAASGPPVGTEAGEIIGEIVIICIAFALQLIWGMPSLIILQARKCGFLSYIVGGVTTSIITSIAIAYLLQAPKIGESAGIIFCYVYLYWGIPVCLGYILAWGTKERKDITLQRPG
jgi:hypothetical protein